MHLITDVVVKECQEGLRNVDIGVFTLCCLHTSAGLTVRHLRMNEAYQLIFQVNENYDP